MLGHTVTLVQLVHVSRRGELHEARDELEIEGEKEGGGSHAESLGFLLKNTGEPKGLCLTRRKRKQA